MKTVSNTMKVALLGCALLGCAVSCSQVPDMVLPPTVTSPAMKRTFERAKQNDIAAIQKIAECYSRGENGFPDDDREAANWYLLGAQLGDASCQFSIASRYMYGNGRWPSVSKAEYWMRRAADNGDTFAAKILPEVRDRFNRYHGIPQQ